MTPDLATMPAAGRYACILADPPWAFTTYSAKGLQKSAQAHYACMTLADLTALPVAAVAAPDCHLAMWATWPMLPQALATMAAWGFTYKTGGAWAKQSSTGRKWQFGTGYLFRSASELLLLGARGSPKWLSRSERNLWVAPVRAHSQKPEEVRDMLRRATAGPRLELFANDLAEGFDSWGLGHDRR